MRNRLNNLNVATVLEINNIYVHSNQENLEGTYRICNCSFCREETSDSLETNLDKDMPLESKPPGYLPGHYPKPQTSSRKIGFRETFLTVIWGILSR